MFDLHTHTTLSDGALTPIELISRAIEMGVDALAITDHDTIDAYRDIPLVHDRLKLIPGIELSTQWGSTGIHVLGLNIDLGSDAIVTAATSQTDARLERARRIAENLKKKGIEDTFEQAKKLSAGGYIGRPQCRDRGSSSGS